MVASPSCRPVPQRFEFVREWNDLFLQLFPHRGDFIWAKHPEPGKRPEWKTESRYLLSDRAILQGKTLFGVRFGAFTQYLMLDVDIHSRYHPKQDPFAIWEMLAALEPLGLVSYVAVTSSSSGGLHLYFPFEEPQKSWAIALAAKTLLENKGFKCQGGQLELFPNFKPYSGAQTNYNGHRLPLQQGSYLVNQEWQPVFTTPSHFIKQWQTAEHRNDVTCKSVDRVVEKVKQSRYGKRLRVSGQKYYNDLLNDLKDGFTGPHQSQFILAKVANVMRVFHHAIHGGSPLEGEALAARIAEFVRNLPGFEEYCGHKHEVDQLAKAWARAAERRYYPYGSQKPLLLNESDRNPSELKLTLNQQRAQDAQERIRQAIADLLKKNALPAQATARRNAIRAYGIGNKTLDKNRNLWHPEFLKSLPEREYHPIDSTLKDSNRSEPMPEGKYHPIHTNKLLCSPSPAPPAQGEADIDFQTVGGSGGLSTDSSADQSVLNEHLAVDSEVKKGKPGPALIREILRNIAVRNQQAKQHPHSKQDQKDWGQQFSELPEGNSCPSMSASPVSDQDVSACPDLPHGQDASLSGSLELIQAAIATEILRLGWVPDKVSDWVAQQFAGKRHCQLKLEELDMMLWLLRHC